MASRQSREFYTCPLTLTTFLGFAFTLNIAVWEAARIESNVYITP